MTTDASPSVTTSGPGGPTSAKPSPGGSAGAPKGQDATRPVSTGSPADTAAQRAVANGGANRPSSPGLSSGGPAKPLVTNNPTAAARPAPSARPSSSTPAPSPYTGLSGPGTPRPGSNGGTPTGSVAGPNWPDNSYSSAPPAAPSYAGTTSAPPRPEVAEQGAPPAAPGQTFTPRVARLTVASIDPFSALKLSFLLSVAAGIALVVASVVLWLVLSGIGVFDQLNNVLGDLGMNTQNKKFDIYDYIGFGRVVSLSIVIGVINTLLLTALATVTAFLYNLSAGLVGGVRVTLSDD